MSKKVSIIIPMYNSEKYIQNALMSAAQQSYKNIEILVIDDGSSDISLEIVKKYAKKDKRIKVYSRKNHGVSATRNYGISESTGDFVFFLDADDTIDKNVISNLVGKFTDDNLASCRIQFVEQNNKTPVSCNSVYSSDKFVEGILENNNNIHGYSCGFLFRRDLCPLFDEGVKYCEDMLFLIKYITNNKIKNLRYLDDKDGHYNYIQNIESTTVTNKNIPEKIQNITLAMDILDVMTDKMYSNLVEEKKMLLFRYEMPRATKEEMVGILKKYKLKKYNGRSIRNKLFVYSFRKKRIHFLLIQFGAERFFRKCLKGNGGGI